MKVLITGGAGYIGSTLVRRLLARADIFSKVTVLDNLMYRQTSLLDLFTEPHFEFVHGDVRDGALLDRLAAQADVVIPLAAIVGMPACNSEPVLAGEVNVKHVRNLARWKRPDQLLVYPNTNSGYGVGEKDKFCTETSPLRPISAYGIGKCEAEKAVLDAGGVSLRLATVFGLSPRMRLDLLVNDFTYRACRDGFVVLFEADFKRNYIHVQDVCRAFMKVIYHRKSGEVYNVGLSTANLSKRELCEVIKKRVPKFTVLESEVGTDTDKRDYIVSNEKLEGIGWSPSHTLEMGVDELVKGYPMLRRVETAAFSNL